MQKQFTILFLMTMLSLSRPILAQQDFREETIYFLMTTRFFDGDASNNVPNEWSSYHPDAAINAAITDPNDVTWRGDFKGLMDKLDYIQDLGFTAIWITPVVQNWSPLDYHGYHAYDFTKVDPRLESPGATFQDLINATHARGMKIVLDIVTNHSGRFGIKDVAEIKYNTDPAGEWGQDTAGNPLTPNPNWEYDGLTPNPADGKIWSRANLPTLPAPYNEDLAQHNWPSTVSYVNTTDTDWYHQSGNGFAQGYDDTENLYNRALAGDTPDFNTSSQVLRDYLVDAYTTFINMGVDAFRWDTMKHMDKEDVLYFKDAFHAVNPDLFIFGEVAQKRHELHSVEEINPHWYTWRGAVNASENSDIAVLDFYAEATFHGVFEEGGNFSGVTAASRYDHLYSDPSTLLTWLDNHDFGPNNDWNARYGGSEENLAACMNFMFTWRGIPVVYYGTEVQFMKGVYADIHDASGIEKSIDETGRAYYGDEFATAPNHVIYQHIKKLNAMRRAIPALQKGTWRWDGNAGGNAVGYVRQYNDSEVAVGLAKDGGATFNFSGLTNGIYRDAVTGAEINVNNGSISFDVTSGSAGIFVLNGPGMIGGNGVGYFQAGIGGGNPVVGISPNGGVYANPIQVSISGSSPNGNTTIYYTTDGSTPGENSAVYTGSIAVTDNVTIKAIAIDTQGGQSSIASEDYVIGEVDGFSVYYHNTSGWSNPTIYHWAASPSGVLADASWPGVAMTAEGEGWYRFDFNEVASTNLILSDNGGSQTDDLARATNGWYENGAWLDIDPRGTVNESPTIAIQTAGANYDEGTSVDVVITASDDSGVVAIYYTLDGSVPDVNASLYDQPISINSDLTVNAVAIDGTGLNSTVVSASYTFSVPASGLKIHFKPTGYTNPEVYYWAVTPSASTTSWPGQTMIDEGEGWYGYTLMGATCSNLIFSNDGGSQTDDLNRCSEGWYVDGTWYDNKPESNVGLTIHFKKPVNWSNANMHYWAVTPSTVQGTSWPGVSMVSEGNDWYSYTIAEATCANIVFSDNGSSQTSDLTRCGEGWYDGSWSSNARLSSVVEELPKASLEIYPNPSDHGFATLHYDLLQEEVVSLDVHTISGQLLWSDHDIQSVSGAHSIVLNTDGWESGMYLIQLRTGNEVYKKRLIVE